VETAVLHIVLVCWTTAPAERVGPRFWTSLAAAAGSADCWLLLNPKTRQDRKMPLWKAYILRKVTLGIFHT